MMTAVRPVMNLNKYIYKYIVYKLLIVTAKVVGCKFLNKNPMNASGMSKIMIFFIAP